MSHRALREIVMIRAAVVGSALLFLLAGCGADSAQNAACAQQPHSATPSTVRGPLPWGYYPGYGCGPVPPAQTHFS
jgi:hypothetical protein